jgi:peptidoglycan hydrolase-like protein with peptidoglycan-binding domain
MILGRPVAGAGGFGYVVRSPQIQRIQYALRNAAAFVADTSLQVTPDGVLGPRTRAAINRALSTYDTEAPYPLRTGTLTPRQILRYAGTIAPAIESLAPL